jgi:RNA polymerase sigma-70 factor (ECF subfamily)
MTTVASTSLSSIEVAYRSHGHHVLRRATRLLGSDAEAREVLQEVFLSLIDDPSQFSGRSSLSTWLYAATTNRCLNRLRNERARLRLVAERVDSLPMASPPAPAEDAMELRELLARLPSELAAVAVYYYADEMTHEEIASVIGCSRRHVGNLLERIARALAEVEEAS